MGAFDVVCVTAENQSSQIERSQSILNSISMCVHVNNRVINNTASGNCGSRQWQNGPERKTMATYLQANGYATFYGGKYLNQVIENISFKIN
jgi:hypothetical protein